MKRLIIAAGWLCLPLLCVNAQNRPRIEVLGGFSYADIVTSEDQFKAKGWHAMLAVNSRQRWFEFVADFSGHYGTLNGAPTSTHVMMAGIRFSFQRGRFVSFTHSMYGISFGRPPLVTNQDFENARRVWFTFVPAGGGTDFVLHRKLALRLVQIDVVVHSPTPTYLQSYPQVDQQPTLQVRISTGIVLRLGRI